MVVAWHPQDIIAGIRKGGWTHQRISEHLGISRSTVTLTIQTGSSPQVRAFISQLLGLPEAELWPFRFPCPPEDLVRR
jgi:lambda repressor-like predicted transcriptional regulator